MQHLDIILNENVPPISILVQLRVDVCKQLLWALGSLLEAYIINCVPGDATRGTSPGDSGSSVMAHQEHPNVKRRKVVSIVQAESALDTAGRALCHIASTFHMPIHYATRATCNNN